MLCIASLAKCSASLHNAYMKRTRCGTSNKTLNRERVANQHARVMVAFRWALTTASTAALLALGAPALAANVGVLQPCIDAGEVQRAVQLLNALRERGAPCAKAGMASAKPLVWEERLAATAGQHAGDMALTDQISHIDSKQRGFQSRLVSGGYEARVAGENLAVGQADFAAALQAWVDSPAHCATLMTPAYTEVGLACVQRVGSRYERFWVAHLGLPFKEASKKR